MKQFKHDLRRLPMTLVGFVFLSIGVALTKRSTLGMAPWGVFHEGLSFVTGISFGVIIQLVGLVVLLISMFFMKTKIGLGTILNVAFVGLLINLFDWLFRYEPDAYTSKVIVFLLGLVILSFGRSLYIASRLGAGPRDGLFVGLSRTLNIQVKYIKPAIELTVLLLGYLFGGIVGLGTIIAALTSGYLVQVFFKVLSYDPSDHTQSNIFHYFQK